MVKVSKLLTFHKQDLMRVKKKGASHVASLKRVVDAAARK